MNILGIEPSESAEGGRGLGETSTLNHTEEENVFPTTPAKILRAYPHYLNNYEKAEILSFKQVYYIPMGKDKLASSEDLRRGGVANFGYDDDKGDYRF